MSASDFYEDFDESYWPVIDKYHNKIRKALKAQDTYPPRENVFRVYKKPISSIKVVILGQDPYHGYGQATGLSFSCDNDRGKLQPSLANMFKEIKHEFPERNYTLSSGNLSRWYDEEDIFLINVALTVKAGGAGSLLPLWQDFTNAMIQYIATYNKECVFLLMGSPAKKVIPYILFDDNNNKERIETCIHPSPLSAYRGFFGSNVFKKIEKRIGPINWETDH